MQEVQTTTQIWEVTVMTTLSAQKSAAKAMIELTCIPAIELAVIIGTRLFLRENL